MQIVVDSKDRRDLAASLVQGIRAEDCPIKVVIEPYIEAHTDDQRGLFHSLCRRFSQETGYSEAAIKEFVKKEILGTEVIEINGRQREVTCSSEYDNGKPRDRISYSELVDGIYRIAAEGGFVI